MKPTPTSPDTSPAPAVDILAFGAHPDDIEFGCGAVIARETAVGHTVHFVVCSRGESGTNGTPNERAAEAAAGASLLNASLEFLDLGGDAHFEIRTTHTLALAAAMRRHRPGTVLAPTPHPNQHPDHTKLGQMVRDASRLARYGGVEELKGLPPHAINALLFYAITADAELPSGGSILIDISDPAILATWTAAMEAHGSQLRTRDYIDFQLTRAKLHGHRAGLTHATPLFPDAPLILQDVASLRTGRHF